jgi:hypothetical protein
LKSERSVNARLAAVGALDALAANGVERLAVGVQAGKWLVLLAAEFD